MAPGIEGELIDGRYRLRREIGAGAMGRVYAAEAADGRRVALKLLAPGRHDRRSARDRFEREVMIAARAAHPHVAEISDFGHCEDGRLYLVMELLEGPTLGELLDREATLPTERALGILCQLLDALEGCHRAGVVHRDIKPDNIFILADSATGGDRLKLVDFGIAKLVGAAEVGQTALTSIGLILGTPAYIAPEWMTSDRVDGRADLYSAAIVLFEMLAGRPPFDSEDKREVMAMHLGAPRPGVADVHPSAAVGEDVEALLQQALDVDPARRFADAAAFRHAVLHLLGIASEPAMPSSREKTWALDHLAAVPPAGADRQVEPDAGPASAMPPSSLPRPPAAAPAAQEPSPSHSPLATAPPRRAPSLPAPHRGFHPAAGAPLGGPVPRSSAARRLLSRRAIAAALVCLSLFVFAWFLGRRSPELDSDGVDRAVYAWRRAGYAVEGFAREVTSAERRGTCREGKVEGTAVAICAGAAPGALVLEVDAAALPSAPALRALMNDAKLPQRP